MGGNNNLNAIMPLESLPDRFGDATHEELDKAVNKAALAGWSNLPNPFVVPSFEQNLISYIVRHSKGELDPRYRLLEENETLIEAHQELRDMLVSAWERRSYREIRNLGTYPFPLSICLISTCVSDEFVFADILKNPASAMQPSVRTTSDMEPES